MSYRTLAMTFFRCWGIVSIVMAIFNAAAYIPLAWGAGTPNRNILLAQTILCPLIAGVIGGLLLLLFARPLSRLVTGDLE